MRLLTAAEQRALDALAAEAELPTRALMESAGNAIAQAALANDFARGAIFCGPGNNGGDGYVAARFLREAKQSGHGRGPEQIVCIATTSLEKLKGDARSAAIAWSKSGGTTFSLDELEKSGGEFAWLARGDVVVDAVFGSGLSRDPKGDEARAIVKLNEARDRGARLIAVDLPSGLDADTGALFPNHLARADLTVTFHLPKRGLVIHPGAAIVGELRVAPIGIPHALEEQLSGPVCELLDEAWARAMFVPRKTTAHKQDFGHVLVVAGSRDKSGAALLVCEGALKAGAGLVTLCARPEVIERVLPQLPEVMSIPLPSPEGHLDSPLGMHDLPAIKKALKGMTALAIGPGIHKGRETGPLIGALLAAIDPGCACVIDADGLNAIAEHREEIAAWCGKPSQRPVLTPHPKEFSRLTGEEVEAIESDRLGAATRAAERFSCTIVLKGARTVVAEPAGATGICGAGNPGMATAGSGDVLTGITAAMLGRKGGPGSSFERAQLAVLLHAMAGDEVAALQGESGMVASDLFRIGLARVFHKLER
jgi:hydroxyethylthiazole kinase-like uncharacterized protein yjeF